MAARLGTLRSSDAFTSPSPAAEGILREQKHQQKQQQKQLMAAAGSITTANALLLGFISSASASVARNINASSATTTSTNITQELSSFADEFQEEDVLWAPSDSAAASASASFSCHGITMTAQSSLPRSSKAHPHHHHQSAEMKLICTTSSSSSSSPRRSTAMAAQAEEASLNMVHHDNPPLHGTMSSSSSSSSSTTTSSSSKNWIIPLRDNRPLPSDSDAAPRLRPRRQSAPVQIPHWSTIVAQARGKMNCRVEDAHCKHEDEDEVHDERLPPHEFLAQEYARSQRTSFSVCEGLGRTLKGRDLSRVRNAVWSQMGFAD